MELHQLRYFLAVSRTGSFSRAADECHVSQPSLSQQILKLEGELGLRLFDRLNRRAVMTPAGEAFAGSAERILAEVDAAQGRVRDAGTEVGGTVVVGALPTIAPYLLPGVISSFCEKFPEVQVVVHEDITAQLVKQAESSNLDLALLVLPIASTLLEQEPLMTEELLLALPPGHALARKKEVCTSDLRAERFILMREGHCLGDLALDFCSRNDFHPHVSCRSAQIETMLALVHTGLGVSLIPAMARSEGRPLEPVYRSITEPRPRRTIGVFWHKQRYQNRATAEFLNHLRRTTISKQDTQRRKAARSRIKGER